MNLTEADQQLIIDALRRAAALHKSRGRVVPDVNMRQAHMNEANRMLALAARLRTEWRWQHETENMK